MKILLIAGGWSPEREVSLSGARVIEASLLRLGHEVQLFDPEFSLDGLLDAASRNDFAFINLHGSPGEDGLVQAMLEAIGCPYQGSGPRGSFLALNKASAKQLFRRAGLNTPDWQLLTKQPDADWQPSFGYPVFIKSNTGGSSIDMEFVHKKEELAPALERLFKGKKGVEFIVEPAIHGVEVTCGILGNIEKAANGSTVEIAKALPPILIRPKANSEGIFDYASKYTAGGAEELCPAPLPDAIYEQIQSMALAAHRILGLRGYSRSDFILKENGAIFMLEVNTLPGMTNTSLVPQEAAAIGLSFDALITRLIELGTQALRERSQHTNLYEGA